MKRISHCIGRAAFSALIALSTYGTSPAAAASGENRLEKSSIQIAGPIAVVNAIPIFVADKLGYFKDQGLNVTWVNFSSATVGFTAVSGGTVDLAFGALQQVIQTDAQGGHLVQIVATSGTSGVALLVNNDLNEVKSVKDIANLNIGISAPGSSTDFVLRMAFKSAGLNPDSSKIVAVGLGATAVAAFNHGLIQALFTIDPAITQLVDAGRAHVLVDTRSLAGVREVFGGSFSAGGIATTRDFLKANPHTVAAFSRGVAKALSYIKIHSTDDVVALLSPSDWYPDGNKAFFTKTFEGVKAAYGDGTTSAEQAATVLESIKVGDPKSHLSNVDLANTYYNGWVTE